MIELLWHSFHNHVIIRPTITSTKHQFQIKIKAALCWGCLRICVV